MIGELFTAMATATWAIQEDALRAICSAIHAETIGAKSARKLPKVAGNVAVLPLHGVISQRSSIWQEVFGGTDTEGFGAAFTTAINSPKVGAVLLDVDSPGGTINGVPELADVVYRGSQIKPVAAIADTQMASAAYWVGSQVGGSRKRLAAAPSADVGSIGVFRVHEDISEMLAMDGIDVSFIAVPEFKTEANPYEPLSESARVHHMSQVQAAYDMFVGHVARGRGVNKSMVKDAFGKGRMFHAQQAAEMGLVDRVATLGTLLHETGASNAVVTTAQSNALSDELCHAWETGVWQELIDPEAIRRREQMGLRLRRV